MTQDRLYILHIYESTRQIRDFTAEGEEAFYDDSKTQNAVMYSLQTLAESTQRLSDAIKKSRPEIEWAKIAGFRNIAVHSYLNIDLDIVGRVAETELDPLDTAIQAMAKNLGLI